MEIEELPSSSEDEIPSSSTTTRRKTGLGNLISKTAMFLPIGKKKKGKEPVQQQGCASPLEDGWFFSDYFMFYHLFHGLGRWKKVLCYVSGNWLSLIFEQEPANAGSCVNLLEIWSKNTELMVTAKGKRKLNISALTAAGPDVQSWSWPSSIGGGRYHGSVYATAVREAFIKMEDENVTQFHPHPSGQELAGELQSSSHAEFTRVIHSTLLNDVDQEGDRHGIQFSAKDDMWEQEWRQRSGFPLSTFKSRWDGLPRMPIQDISSLRPGRRGTSKAGLTSMEMKTQSYGLHSKFNRRQAITAIKDLAYGYLNSFPLSDNSSTDRTCNGDARALLESEKFPSWKLEGLQAALQYRMDSMRLASAYKALVGLTFADCDKFDFESWQTSILASARTTKSSEDKWNKYKAYRHEITCPPVY